MAKDDAVIFKSIGVRAHWLAYGLAVLLAGAAFMAAWSARQERLWLDMQDAAHEAAREVGLSTRSARDSVYMLQGVANGLLQQRAIELSAEHQKALVERLDIPGSIMMMPLSGAAHHVARASANNHADSPAFSMFGRKPSQGSELGREIEIALALSPALIRVKTTQSAAVAVYYLSGSGFHLIFPAAADELQLFTPDLLQRAPYLNGLVERNPGRTPVWSTAYDDPKGNGLISTLGIPIDDAEGNYRGLAAMDFQLDSLSQYVRKPGLVIGNAFIMDDAGLVIAHPSLLRAASERVPTLAEVTKDAGATGDWNVLRTLPVNNRHKIGGDYALVYDIEATPWRYVLTVNRNTLRWAVLRSMPLEAGALVALLLFLIYAERRRRGAVVALRSKAAEDVLQAAPAPVAVIRQADLSVVLANAALLQLFALPGERSSGEGAAVAHAQLQEIIRRLTAAGAPQEDVSTELPLRRADGSAFWVLLRCVSVVHEEKPAWLCSLTDVSALKQAKDQLETLATTDPLTGALNRRAVGSRGNLELGRAKRSGVGFAALLLDIDHFKRVNDTHGHPTGDRVLQAVARGCQAVLRDVDVFGRWGGEEFVALLPDTDLDGATAAAERLREAIEALPLTLDDGSPIHVTASVGGSVWLEAGDTLEALLMRSDTALYQAKGTGRNRVCVAPAQVSVPVHPTGNAAGSAMPLAA